MSRNPAKPETASERRPTGRPTIRTEAMVREILEGLESGIPLEEICRREGMPASSTVRVWREQDAELASAIARARLDGFDVIAADCLRISDTPEEGEETVTKADGSVEIRRGDMLGHRKLKVDTRLKLLAKWDPKRYGERTVLAGDPEAPLPAPTVVIAPEMARAIAKELDADV